MTDKIPGKPTETGLLLVEAQVIMDREHSSGSMCFTFADTSVEVTDSETGEKLADICGVMGGGIKISDHRTGKDWFISAQALWKAFTETLDVTRA